MDLVGCKVLVLVLLGLIKLVSGLSPLLLVKYLKNRGMKWVEHFMAGLICIGGGVLLSTVFIHMLPEVRESLQEVLEENGEMEYPFAELVLCSGFFTIYLIEAAVHKIFNIQSHSHGIPAGNIQNKRCSQGSIAPFHNPIHQNSSTKSSLNGHANEGFFNNEENHNISTLGSNHGMRSSSLTSVTTSNSDSLSSHKEKDGGNIKYKFTMPKLGYEKQVYNVSSATLTSYTIHSDYDEIDLHNNEQTMDERSSHQRLENLDEKTKKTLLLSKVRSLVIVLALSIHSIFEGMAVGLQDSQEGTLKLFAAVAIHECAILFCVGNKMISNRLRKCEIIFYMVLLALITPVGIAIGLGLTYSSETQSHTQILAVGILQGLAAGTLLYITFFEVLEREKLESVGMTGLLGTFLIIIGFALMAGLEAAGGHSHSHSLEGTNTTAEALPILQEVHHHGHSHGRGHGHSHNH